MFKRLRSSLNKNQFNLRLQLSSMNHFLFTLKKGTLTTFLQFNIPHSTIHSHLIDKSVESIPHIKYKCNKLILIVK